MKRLVGAALLVFGCCAAAGAQDWPTRPVTMVVPFAAGGPVDVLGRILAQHLGEIIGQQVVVENVTGAGGMTGSYRVAQAAPDGHQMVLGSIGTHALNQTLYKRPLYNAATDFAPVALIADVPLVLITRKDLPANDLKEFIAHAKANQAKMQYGSGGAGTSAHIGCVMLNGAMGVDITHIPYRGGGPAMVDLTAGRIDYVCNIISTAVPAIQANNVKAMATLSRERSPVLPSLPTAHEQGLTNFDAYTWNAIFLPKGTPAVIVDKVNAALVKVMDLPAARQRLQALGLSVVAPERRTPGYLAKFVQSEIDKWAGPIKASGSVAE
jgi:tripartite-type tricarboxylate transporter receptor subunit TctC